MVPFIILITFLQSVFHLPYAQYDAATCSGDEILALRGITDTVVVITDIFSGTPTITPTTYTISGGGTPQFISAAVAPGGCIDTDPCIYVMYTEAGSSAILLGTLDTVNNEVIPIGTISGGAAPLNLRDLSFDCAGNLLAIDTETLITYAIDPSTGSIIEDVTDGSGITKCFPFGIDCEETLAFNSDTQTYWRVSAIDPNEGTNILCEGITDITESCLPISDPNSLCFDVSNPSFTGNPISALTYIGSSMFLISCKVDSITQRTVLLGTDGVISDIGFGANEIDMSGGLTLPITGLVNYIDPATGQVCSGALDCAPPTTTTVATTAATATTTTATATTTTTVTTATSTAAATTTATTASTTAVTTVGSTIFATEDGDDDGETSSDSSLNSDSDSDSESDSGDDLFLSTILSTIIDDGDDGDKDEDDDDDGDIEYVARAVMHERADIGFPYDVEDHDDTYNVVINISKESVVTLWGFFSVLLMINMSVIWCCYRENVDKEIFVSSESPLSIQQL